MSADPVKANMNGNQERLEEFRSAIAEMKVSDPSNKSERQWLGVGVALMVIAIALAVYAYFQSGQEGDLEQRELISLGLVAVVLVLTGAALFLRYSLARLLRFWIVRVLFEMRQNAADDERSAIG